MHLPQCPEGGCGERQCDHDQGVHNDHDGEDTRGDEPNTKGLMTIPSNVCGTRKRWRLEAYSAGVSDQGRTNEVQRRVRWRGRCINPLPLLGQKLKAFVDPLPHHGAHGFVSC
jgi:hypothetical protein